MSTTSSAAHYHSFHDAVVAERYDEQHRTAAFCKDPHQENLLAELNNLLSVCQETVNQRFTRPLFPVLLIMGVARSGTTLFYQWLAESQQWGFPSNITARFFRAPYIGARVQQILLEHDYKNEIAGFQKTDPYFSSLGKTRGALAPHEFWYFWRRFFPLDAEADVVPSDALHSVDTARLNAEIASLEAALEKPIAMKALLLNWHIPFLNTVFEKVLFVHIRRDPVHLMQSLMEGRMKNFGSEDLWYAFKPPEYAWLKDMDPITQVAGQVYFTQKAVETGLAQIAEGRQMTVEYVDFCQQPAAFWKELCEKMNGMGYALGPYAGPEQFEATTTIRVSAERWASYRAAFAAFQSQREPE